MKKIKIVLLLTLALSSCKWLNENPNEEEQPKPLARVGEKLLFFSDVKGLITREHTPVDSTEIMQRYIKSWVRKQLLINEAANNIDFNEAEIERKILDYRYALMVYEYEKFYVNQHLDTLISHSEIEEYYRENIDNFELKQNIIRGLFVKLPKEAPKARRIKKMVQDAKPGEKDELRSFAYRFASSYSLEDSLWINFDELILNTPMMGIPNKVQFLKNNRFVESEDDKFIYLLHILDYKISDQTSPLEFVQDDIRNIIINKRKVQLANELEQNIYEEAEQQNDFEIFSYK